MTTTVLAQIDAAGMAGAFCSPARRVKFLDETGEASGTPLQGQAVIYLGPDVDGFVAGFGEFGFCLAQLKGGRA
jgi:hypothetical protein